MELQMNVLIRFRKTIMFGVKILILAAMTFAFIDVWQSAYEDTLFSRNGNYVVILTYLAILITFIQLYGGFRIGVLRLHEIIYSLALATLFTNFIMYLQLSLVARELIVMPPFILGILAQLVIAAVGAYSANMIYFSLFSSRNILAIYGDESSGREIIDKMSRIPERYSIQAGVSIHDTSLEDIKACIDNYEAVLICDFEKSIKNEILRYCYATRKRIYLLPSSNDIIINNCFQTQIFDTPILLCRNRGLSVEQAVLKRAIDLLIASIGLILLSPFMLICALAIKLYDGGPVFFKQNRITRGGKIFNVLKFRSMVVDADKDGAAGATDGDKRITPIGRIIRPIRFDELPQLFNVLMGDMSIVGPRPERIENVYLYTKMLPEFNLRHRVKAGLTGYAQIYGKYNTSPADKLNMDLIYIERYSLLLDFKLMLMTIKILFMKESTEGFTEENRPQMGHKTAEVTAPAESEES